jgi:hypothetical protein
MEKSVKEELQRQFNVLTNLEGRSFFEGLANYIKFIVENPNLTPIINEILNEQKEDIKEFENFIKKYREELDEIVKRLIEVIKENKIRSSIIDQNFEIYEKCKKNPSTILGCCLALRRIINTLRMIGYEKTLSEKRIEENFLKSDDKINKEIIKRIRLEEAKIWVNWRKLEMIYKAIYNQEELLKERDTEIINKNFFGVEEIDEIINEMDWLRGIRTPPPGSHYQYLNKKNYIIPLNNVHNYLISELSEKEIPYGRRKTLQSIHLITETIAIERCNTIFLVLDEHFEMPIRCAVWNKRTGELTSVAKLYNIAYFVNAPGKMVKYDKRLADNINNGLFKKRMVAKYMKTNKLEKPTLVQKQKSEKGNILVLKNEIPVKTGLIKHDVPLQYQSLYIDKTR